MHSSLITPNKTFEYGFSFVAERVLVHDDFIFKPDTVQLTTRWNSTTITDKMFVQKVCRINFQVTEREFDDWLLFSKLSELDCYSCRIDSFLWPDSLFLIVYFEDRIKTDICFHSQIQKDHPMIDQIHRKVLSDIQEELSGIAALNVNQGF